MNKSSRSVLVIFFLHFLMPLSHVFLTDSLLVELILNLNWTQEGYTPFKSSLCILLIRLAVLILLRC